MTETDTNYFLILGTLAIVKEKIRNIVELALGWVVYSPQNNLGIEIIRKNKLEGYSYEENNKIS